MEPDQKLVELIVKVLCSNLKAEELHTSSLVDVLKYILEF